MRNSHICPLEWSFGFCLEDGLQLERLQMGKWERRSLWQPRQELMKVRPDQAGGVRKSHTWCVIYITHPGHALMGHGKRWDVVRGGVRFLVRSAGQVVGGDGAVLWNGVWAAGGRASLVLDMVRPMCFETPRWRYLRGNWMYHGSEAQGRVWAGNTDLQVVPVKVVIWNTGLRSPREPGAWRQLAPCWKSIFLGPHSTSWGHVEHTEAIVPWGSKYLRMSLSLSWQWNHWLRTWKGQVAEKLAVGALEVNYSLILVLPKSQEGDRQFEGAYPFWSERLGKGKRSVSPRVLESQEDRGGVWVPTSLVLPSLQRSDFAWRGGGGAGRSEEGSPAKILTSTKPVSFVGLFGFGSVGLVFDQVSRVQVLPLAFYKMWPHLSHFPFPYLSMTRLDAPH